MLVAHEPGRAVGEGRLGPARHLLPRRQPRGRAARQRGIVERAEDPADRRVKRVRTTKDGDRLVERLIATRIESFEQMLEGFSVTERRKLGDALDEILARPEVARYLPAEGAPMTRLRAITEENRKWWTLGSMCFALFMIMLDNTVVNVALPSIQSDLDASLSALEWTVNVYTLTFAVLLVTGGRLGDIFGRRRAFLFGVVVFALSSATAGLAPNEAWLVASRAPQGIGAAFMMPATLSIITNAFPAHERGKAIGTWAGVSALALALGPVVGGFLTEEVSWRAIFFLNLPGRRGRGVRDPVRDARSRATRPCRARSTTPASPRSRSGIGALVLALVEGNGWGWGSPRILAPARHLGRGPRRVRRRRAPREVPDGGVLVPAQPRRSPGTNGIAFVVSFSMLAMFFFMALYMQNILGYSPLEAGIRFLPSTVMIIIAAPIAGPAHGPDRRAHPDRGRADAGGDRALPAVAHRRRHDVLAAPPHLHPDGTRHRPHDVADVDRRDERGRRDQGRARLGRPLDEPHGRRHVRRRRGRRALPAAQRQPAREPPRDLPLSSQQQAWFTDNLGSGNVSSHLRSSTPAPRARSAMRCGTPSCTRCPPR